MQVRSIEEKNDDALFSRNQSNGDHMSTRVIQHSYRELNNFIGWVTDEGGFYKATIHMMWSSHNTQLINARNALEIREHMMGYKLKDMVRRHTS